VSHRGIVICMQVAFASPFSFVIGCGGGPTSRSDAICRTLCRCRSASLFIFRHLTPHLGMRTESSLL
jgi:hypothetical protein